MSASPYELGHALTAGERLKFLVLVTACEDQLIRECVPGAVGGDRGRIFDDALSSFNVMLKVILAQGGGLPGFCSKFYAAVHAAEAIA